MFLFCSVLLMDRTSMVLMIRNTNPMDPVLPGLPAITVPCGFEEPRDDGGGRLPVGLQIIGRVFGEADMIRVAHAFEQTADFAWGAPPE